MNLSALLHGGGKRRKSDGAWDDLTTQLSSAQALLREREGTVRYSCPDGRHPDWWAPANCPSWCPWCSTGRLYRQLQQMPALGVQVGAPLVPAPADVPGSAFATPALEPAEDPRLRIVADTPAAPAVSEAADVNAKTQAVPVAALRQAVGEGDTMQLPAVPNQAAVRPVVAVTADHLEPARTKVPPKPDRPPQNTFADPDAVVGFATADLQQQVNAAAILAGRTIPVRLAKIPTPRHADQQPA
jgi:hypothetical protein